MKKILFLCLTALFVSCSAEEGWQERGAEESTLAEEFKNIANGYELMIKGYTLEEVKEEKNEAPQEKEAITIAEPWMIKAIQESQNKTAVLYGSKTRTDAQPYGGSANKVGVFKMTTCGNNREFVYHMDCQDDGITRSSGGLGIGATEASGNVTFRFCLVDPGNYGGGTLLLYNYQWDPSEGSVDVVKRYHDNEDKRNANEIMDDGGLANTGLSSFSHNTSFFWRFSDKPRQALPFSYGVLRNSSEPIPLPQLYSGILIDDENSSNGNEAIVWRHTSFFPRPGGTTSAPRYFSGETFRGISAQTDGDTSYILTIY